MTVITTKLKVTESNNKLTNTNELHQNNIDLKGTDRGKEIIGERCPK